MDRDNRLKRLRFRAWHRGTREADYMIGGFYDRLHQDWDAQAMDWFEALLDQEDVDIMGWVVGTIPVPPEWQGAMMRRMQRIDYIDIPPLNPIQPQPFVSGDIDTPAPATPHPASGRDARKPF